MEEVAGVRPDETRAPPAARCGGPTGGPLGGFRLSLPRGTKLALHDQGGALIGVGEVDDDRGDDGDDDCDDDWDDDDCDD